MQTEIRSIGYRISYLEAIRGVSINGRFNISVSYQSIS
jgi:hypothetical protein